MRDANLDTGVDADVAAGVAACAAFIPGTGVPGRDLDRMAALLFETSYLEYCSAGNALRLHPRALQRRQNIDPWLRHIRALYVDGRFAGFYNAAPLREYGATAVVNHYRADVQAMDADYDAFVGNSVAPEELFVASLAIEPVWRGRGLVKLLLAELEDAARAAACPGIALTVWQSSAALPVYLRHGFAVRATFDAAWPLFFDRLLCMGRALDAVPEERQ